MEDTYDSYLAARERKKQEEERRKEEAAKREKQELKRRRKEERERREAERMRNDELPGNLGEDAGTSTGEEIEQEPKRTKQTSTCCTCCCTCKLVITHGPHILSLSSSPPPPMPSFSISLHLSPHVSMMSLPVLYIPDTWLSAGIFLHLFLVLLSVLIVVLSVYCDSVLDTALCKELHLNIATVFHSALELTERITGLSVE